MGAGFGVVREGDEIRLSDDVFTVVTLSGGAARLADAVGEQAIVPIWQLLCDPTLELGVGVAPADVFGGSSSRCA